MSAKYLKLYNRNLLSVVLQRKSGSVKIAEISVGGFHLALKELRLYSINKKKVFQAIQ